MWPPCLFAFASHDGRRCNPKHNTDPGSDDVSALSRVSLTPNSPAHHARSLPSRPRTCNAPARRASQDCIAAQGPWKASEVGEDLGDPVRLLPRFAGHARQRNPGRRVAKWPGDGWRRGQRVDAEPGPGGAALPLRQTSRLEASRARDCACQASGSLANCDVEK